MVPVAPGAIQQVVHALTLGCQVPLQQAKWQRKQARQHRGEYGSRSVLLGANQGRAVGVRARESAHLHHVLSWCRPHVAWPCCFLFKAATIRGAHAVQPIGSLCVTKHVTKHDDPHKPQKLFNPMVKHGQKTQEPCAQGSHRGTCLVRSCYCAGRHGER